MSFLFGGSTKKEVDAVFEIMQGTEEPQQSNISTLITLDDSEIYAYYNRKIYKVDKAALCRITYLCGDTDRPRNRLNAKASCYKVKNRLPHHTYSKR